MDSAIRLQKLAMKDIRQVVDLLVDQSGADEVKLFKHLESHVEDESWLFLLARDGYKPAGVIECSREEAASLSGTSRRGVINTLFVAPEWRRRGVARQLLQTASYWFDAAQLTCVRLELPLSELDEAGAALSALGFAQSHTVFTRK